VSGYSGIGQSFIAMERGELDGIAIFYSAISSTRPAWLSKKQIKILLQFGPERLEEMKQVPFALDLASTAQDKLLMEAAFAPQSFGRPFVMPPDVPVDRVAAVRQALLKVFSDREFQAAAHKIGIVSNAPRTGEQLQAILRRAHAFPPKVIERLRKLNAPGG
jgi:tripartite-type tricarboxylate transporter receptor subunit TctC